MVYRIVVIASLFITTSSFASQLDESLGPQDAPYFQAVSERFFGWSQREYIPRPSAQETRALKVIETQIPELNAWSFVLSENFLWPRFQFALQFKDKKRSSIHFSIFPDNPKLLSAEIAKAYPGLPKELFVDLIGFGFDTSPFQVFIYQKKNLPANFPLGNRRKISDSALKRSTIAPKIGAPAFYLVQTTPPSENSFVFAPIVENWAVWIDETGRFETYQLEFRRFNVRILDDSAISDSKKIGSEFLMANLRLGYISNDNYQIQYP